MPTGVGFSPSQPDGPHNVDTVVARVYKIEQVNLVLEVSSSLVAPIPPGVLDMFRVKFWANWVTLATVRQIGPLRYVFNRVSGFAHVSRFRFIAIDDGWPNPAGGHLVDFDVPIPYP